MPAVADYDPGVLGVRWCADRDGQTAAPLGSVELGRLVFVRGAAHLTLGVDPSMADLYRARFEGKVPDIRVDGGTVTVKYRPSLHRTSGEIALSGRVPWAIKARMGMSDVVADLQALELTGLEISGGVSRLQVRLPHPRRPSEFGLAPGPATSS